MQSPVYCDAQNYFTALTCKNQSEGRSRPNFSPKLEPLQRTMWCIDLVMGEISLISISSIFLGFAEL